MPSASTSTSASAGISTRISVDAEPELFVFRQEREGVRNGDLALRGRRAAAASDGAARDGAASRRGGSRRFDDLRLVWEVFGAADAALTAVLA